MHCKSLLTAIDAYLEKASDGLSGHLGKAGYAKPKKTVQTIDEIEDELVEALDEQTASLVQEINQSADLATFARATWPAWRLADSTGASIALIFRTALREFMPEYVEYYVERVEGPLGLPRLTQRTVDWVDGWSQQLGQIMQLSSHQELDRILKKGLDEGNGINWYENQILDADIRDVRYKARRVALTEVLRAHSYANLEAMRQSPSVIGKVWRHSEAPSIKQPRPHHVVMDGTQVQGVDEPFVLTGPTGTYECLCPRDITLPPEESINCHCFMDNLIDESVHGLPLEERAKLREEAVEKYDDEWLKQQQLAARCQYAKNPDDWTEEAWQQAHDERAARGKRY